MRHREGATRAAAEAAAARRAADGRMQGLAGEQLRALEEAEVTIGRLSPNPNLTLTLTLTLTPNPNP